jgi:hypothetical protein
LTPERKLRRFTRRKIPSVLGYIQDEDSRDTSKNSGNTETKPVITILNPEEQGFPVFRA